LRPAAIALGCLVALGASAQPVQSQREATAVTSPTGHAHTNRLIHATSPYLLQHAHNPVDWFPWGEEALAKARAEDKPVFLSIGYSACHWCHVMERESFENETIAAFLNEHYVSIKVDREERPDIDDIYMTAVQLQTGSGGWPMSVFLMPDGRPFYSGTYFPPVDRHGTPGFMTILHAIQHAWANERDKVVANADAMTRALADIADAGKSGDAPSPTGAIDLTTAATAAAPAIALIESAAAGFARQFDPTWGGFGGAPKFPPSMTLNLLLREHRRAGDAKLLAMVETTLDRMARGGMRDQLAGGFHRYSTDERWLVPHFEKMLYDNALLARVYADAWRATGNEDHLRVCRSTLDYVIDEMTAPGGGFYSAQDADSEGVEGKYFIWTPEQIHALLDEPFGADEAQRFCDFFDVKPGGNWHEGDGASILNVPAALDPFAKARNVDPAALRDRFDAMRARLLTERRLRVPPLTDDKILASWNGMMIGAMAHGAQITGDERYARAAERAADFILTNMRDADGDLLRSWREGTAGSRAFLEDHAQLIGGLIDLYETTFDRRWIDAAADLAARMIAKFADPAGGPFFTGDGADPTVLVRMKDLYDGATPSGNSTAVHALLRLGTLLDRADWRDAARRVLAHQTDDLRANPRGFAHMLCAVADFEIAPPTQIAVIGDPNDPATSALLQTIHRAYLPGGSIALAATTDPADPIALLRDKKAIDGRPTAYVCRGTVCLPPVHESEKLRQQLSR
jgi:hypothetical protein